MADDIVATDETTLWNNIKGRVGYIENNRAQFLPDRRPTDSDGWEWAYAIVEELERVHEELRILRQRGK